jgi:NAD(P)-dependent dehydrogenase (short-subunit alcohol dehydrogenase family)
VSVEDLNGRRCFITGAASGIGRATAIAAAAKGAEVLITDIDASGLADAAREIGDSGGRVGHAAAVDVADHDRVVALAEAIHRDYGSMDVVMNVAGVSTWGPIERLRHSDWQKMIDVNLMGPISVLECFVPPMIEAGRGGQIVNVSSSAGLFGLPWHAAYSASKFGLRGISEVLRFDLRRHDIGVTLVCPGAVRTGLVETVDIVGVDREHPSVKKLVKVFERRAVSPESVAEKIIRGIERDRYLVFTSRDIQFGHWVQRKFAPPYNLAMRVMNDRLTAVGERARRPAGEEPARRGERSRA